jgi:hypothetical protein
MNTHVKIPATAETFAVAFVKLQSDIKPAIKDANNPAFRSKYADLGAVWEAIKEPLATHGFSVIQSPDFDGDSMWLKTTVLHVSGESMVGRYPLRPVKQDPQGFGSALTYARRYSISAMLGVIADDDDDGNSASGRGGNGSPTPPHSQRDVIHNSPTLHQDDDVTEGVKNWVEKEKHFLNNCVTVGDVTAWKELRAEELARLKRKALPAWSELMKWSEARIGNINLGGK